jgi:hypothetical protein
LALLGKFPESLTGCGERPGLAVLPRNLEFKLGEVGVNRIAQKLPLAIGLRELLARVTLVLLPCQPLGTLLLSLNSRVADLLPLAVRMEVVGALGMGFLLPGDQDDVSSLRSQCLTKAVQEISCCFQ